MGGPDRKSGTSTFTDRELDVMSVLWRRGSGTVAEVREELGGDEVGYTTVLKMLQILEEKACVRHEEEGRAYRYFPLVDANEAGGHALRRIVDKIFHGSTELLVARLVGDADLGPDDLARLRRVLAEAEEEAGTEPSGETSDPDRGGDG